MKRLQKFNKKCKNFVIFKKVRVGDKVERCFAQRNTLINSTEFQTAYHFLFPSLYIYPNSHLLWTSFTISAANSSCELSNLFVNEFVSSATALFNPFTSYTAGFLLHLIYFSNLSRINMPKITFYPSSIS